MQQNGPPKPHVDWIAFLYKHLHTHNRSSTEEERPPGERQPTGSFWYYLVFFANTNRRGRDDGGGTDYDYVNIYPCRDGVILAQRQQLAQQQQRSNQNETPPRHSSIWRHHHQKSRFVSSIVVSQSSLADCVLIISTRWINLIALLNICHQHQHQQTIVCCQSWLQKWSRFEICMDQASGLSQIDLKSLSMPS